MKARVLHGQLLNSAGCRIAGPLLAACQNIIQYCTTYERTITRTVLQSYTYSCCVLFVYRMILREERFKM